MNGLDLPRPAAWTERALCAEVGGDGWFPEPGVPLKEIKAVCRRCPARDECLTWAIEHGELWGVWGGMGERERANLRAKMRRRGVA